jgi:hypothetical protein
MRRFAVRDVELSVVADHLGKFVGEAGRFRRVKTGKARVNAGHPGRQGRPNRFGGSSYFDWNAR